MSGPLVVVSGPLVVVVVAGVLLQLIGLALTVRVAVAAMRDTSWDERRDRIAEVLALQDGHAEDWWLSVPDGDRWVHRMRAESIMWAEDRHPPARHAAFMRACVWVFAGSVLSFVAVAF